MDSQKDAAMGQKEQGSQRAWYVIHTYSGYENKVKANLERKVASQGLSDVIFNVVVPMEDETEEKEDGRQKVVQRKVFPGYVLVEMIVNNYSWYVVRNTQGVTGFVGSEKDPIPLTEEEARRVLGADSRKLDKRSVLDAEVGDTVHVISGLFEGYSATVQEIDSGNKRLTVRVEGKLVELGFDEVERV